MEEVVKLSNDSLLEKYYNDKNYDIFFKENGEEDWELMDRTVYDLEIMIDATCFGFQFEARKKAA